MGATTSKPYNAFFLLSSDGGSEVSADVSVVRFLNGGIAGTFIARRRVAFGSADGIPPIRHVWPRVLFTVVQCLVLPAHRGLKRRVRNAGLQDEPRVICACAGRDRDSIRRPLAATWMNPRNLRASPGRKRSLPLVVGAVDPQEFPRGRLDSARRCVGSRFHTRTSLLLVA